MDKQRPGCFIFVFGFGFVRLLLVLVLVLVLLLLYICYLRFMQRRSDLGSTEESSLGRGAVRMQGLSE